MKVSVSWLREYVDLPACESGRDVQAKLISVGLEVETVDQLGAGLKGPLVVGLDVVEDAPQALLFFHPAIEPREHLVGVVDRRDRLPRISLGL